MSGGISGIGKSGSIPQEPPKEPETNGNQLDAINTFNDLTQILTSLASEAKLGGKK